MNNKDKHIIKMNNINKRIAAIRQRWYDADMKLLNNKYKTEQQRETLAQKVQTLERKHDDLVDKRNDILQEQRKREIKELNKHLKGLNKLFKEPAVRTKRQPPKKDEDLQPVNVKFTPTNCDDALEFNVRDAATMIDIKTLDKDMQHKNPIDVLFLYAVHKLIPKVYSATIEERRVFRIDANQSFAALQLENALSVNNILQFKRQFLRTQYLPDHVVRATLNQIVKDVKVHLFARTQTVHTIAVTNGSTQDALKYYDTSNHRKFNHYSTFSNITADLKTFAVTQLAKHKFDVRIYSNHLYVHNPKHNQQLKDFLKDQILNNRQNLYKQSFLSIQLKQSKEQETNNQLRNTYNVLKRLVKYGKHE